MAELHCRQTMNLLKAGKFSDLTLVCKDNPFPVQKALVCVLSSVLAESLYGPAANAEQTGTSDMNRFESDTVQSFVDFVYDGDYKAKKSKSSASSESSEVEDDADILPELLSHVRAHHFACHYKVAKMEDIASSKLKSLLAEYHGEEVLISSLPAVIEAARALESSPDLMDILAASAAGNISQLQKNNSFAALAGAEKFLLMVIKHCALNVEIQAKAITQEFTPTVTESFDLTCRACKETQGLLPVDPSKGGDGSKNSDTNPHRSESQDKGTTDAVEAPKPVPQALWWNTSPAPSVFGGSNKKSTKKSTKSSTQSPFVGGFGQVSINSSC